MSVCVVFLLLLQDLEVAAEFQICESVSVSQLMSKLAETNHLKVRLLAILILVSQWLAI